MHGVGQEFLGENPDTSSQIAVKEAAVIVLVADGLRPDVLDAAIATGDVPELASLRDTSGRHVITTVFPSVTGVAYVPMLTGRHPAELGIPGLRWYDRSRRLPAIIGHSRSYVGVQLRRLEHDLEPGAPTAFDAVNGHALGSAAMITRGLPRRNQVDRGWRHAAGVIRAHVTGDVGRWADLEEGLADTLVARIRRERPRFVFAAFTAGDKAAHAAGTGAAGVRRSLRLVDHVAASIRADAEHDGRWKAMHLWVVSDHGHSAVHHHLDLAAALRRHGVRVRAHPWTVPDRSEAAVMVSGNSMAHVYLGLDAPARRCWPALEPAWESRLEPLWSHPAVDLVATMSSPSTVDVRRGSSRAEIAVRPRGFAYRPLSGDPLGIVAFEDLCEAAAHERTIGSDYPDGVVQLARLVLASRSGDVVISASPGWDLRRRYEPIEHVSSHGALHAAHMMVPLSGNRRLTETPRRTSDLHRFLMRAIESEGGNDPMTTFAGAHAWARGV